MSYVTLEQLIARFGAERLGQLTNATDPEVPDPVVIGRAIADAAASVDGFLATRYTVPLSVVPDLICKLTGDLTLYHLYVDGAPESVQLLYRDARQTLRDLSTGIQRLPGLDGVSAPATPGGVQFQAAARVFGGDGGWSY